MADSSAKGNPASHRMSNPNLKARRQRSWNKAQVEKPKRHAANAARAAANAEIRARGDLEYRESQARTTGDPAAWLTPHELQRMKRRDVRDDKRSRGLLPPIGTTRAEWQKRVGVCGAR